jgi:putative flippase GtrA
MSILERFRLAQVVEEHGAKLLRYFSVSAFNVVVGIGTLTVCLEVFDLSPVVANVTSWTIGTIPAYLLSRYWVWQQSGANSVRSEVAPFWILALVGLSFSTLCIWIAGSFTDRSILLVGANFAAYGVVWVARYLVLENLMWGKKKGRPEVEVV